MDLSGRPALQGRCARHKTCRAFAICWAVVGTGGCAYLFLSSTVPVTGPDEVPLWGPQWFQGTATGAALTLGVPWLVAPVALLVIGLVQIHRGGRASRRWQLGWAVSVAAAISLEVMLIAGFGVPFVVPNYLGAAVVGWIWLAEAAGCLAVGAAMLAILTRAGAAAPRA